MVIEDWAKELEKYLEPIKDTSIGITTLEQHLNKRMGSTNWSATLLKITNDNITNMFNYKVLSNKEELEKMKDWFIYATILLKWIYRNMYNISWEVETRPLELTCGFSNANQKDFYLSLRITPKEVHIKIKEDDLNTTLNGNVRAIIDRDFNEFAVLDTLLTIEKA